MIRALRQLYSGNSIRGSSDGCQFGAKIVPNKCGPEYQSGRGFKQDYHNLKGRIEMQEGYILVDDIRVDNPKLQKLILSGFIDNDAALRRWIELMVFNKMAYILDGYFELFMPWDLPNDPYIRVPGEDTIFICG
jgi:hypothetical protein